MQLGIFPAGALAAAQTVQQAQTAHVPQPGDPDYVWPLEEIEGSATRDYFPAIVAGVIVALALTSKSKRGKRGILT